jgi:pyrimidine-nucleoside phosphorylase
VHPYALIRRKRDGDALAPEELAGFMDAYLTDRVGDEQMAAMLMAIYFRGLEPAELDALVDAMLNSGEALDVSGIPGLKVDKHSTGGVGDKVSLVLAPLAAALGLRVPMMSGRGLGHTGGTVDKLHAIPGFRTALTLPEARRQLERVGCVLMTQTEHIVPLDRRLYGLRDLTATVESIPLIAASIMSKKLAEGLDALVVDVKRGNGAFLPELERGEALATTMIRIGEARGCRVVALVTAMDRPLGHAIGNALEVEEAVAALRDEGPADLRELTLCLATEMLMLEHGATRAGARARAEAALADGSALRLMARVVEAQGGNPGVLDDPAVLPQAPVIVVLEADAGGVVATMDTRAIGDAAVMLGAGRLTAGDAIDPAVGFHLTVKPGDRVEPGEPLGTVHARHPAHADRALSALRRAIHIADRAAPALPLVSHRIDRDGVAPVAPATP